jgi:hypothetical protein
VDGVEAAPDPVRDRTQIACDLAELGRAVCGYLPRISMRPLRMTGELG